MCLVVRWTRGGNAVRFLGGAEQVVGYFSHCLRGWGVRSEQGAGAGRKP